MPHQELWPIVRPEAGEDCGVWAYGDPPDLLAELTRTGVRTATASAGTRNEIVDRPIFQAEENNAIVNWNTAHPAVYATIKWCAAGLRRTTQFDAKCPDRGRACVHDDVIEQYII